MIVSGGERFSGTAKARARKGTLLDEAMFAELLNCKQLSDVAHILTNTYYCPHLPADVETFHRNKLEAVLLNVRGKEARSFFSCVGLERRNFLELWVQRQDIVLLKNRLWEIMSGLEKDGGSLPSFREELEDVDFKLVDKHKLLAAKSLPELMSSIKNQKLVTFLEEAIKQHAGNTAFVLGFALDYFQYERMFAAASDFSGTERDELRSLVGVAADLMNITWMYRAKKSFGASAEVALSLVLPVRYRAQIELLREVASREPERMFEPLAGTMYKDLLPTESPPLGGGEGARMGRKMGEIEKQNALRVFRSGSPGLHFVIAYLTLREIEISLISGIIEIVRYDFDRKKVLE